MSLATAGGLTAGGGVGGGGLILAHGPNAVGARAAPPPPQGNAHFDSGATAPPPSSAALGADLLDKQQTHLSLRQVQQVAKYPLVALDAYAERPTIAYYPPKPEDPSKAPLPTLVGKLTLQVAMQGNNETAHKTLRKWLSQSKIFDSLRQETLAKKLDDPNNVIIDKPHRWLGIRRFSDVPDFYKEGLNIDNSDTSPAIAEVSSPAVGVSLALGTLDGSPPLGDDYDRVVYHVRLNPRKKAVTVLPEEATQIFLHQAQRHVANKSGINNNNNSNKENSKEGNDDDNNIVVEDFPIVLALPSFCMHDAAIEAWLDAAPGAVIVPRSVAALAGALLPSTSEDQPNSILERLGEVRNALHQEYKKNKVKDNAAQFVDDVLFILCGSTPEGFECTAIQVSKLQSETICCLFGNYKVLANVSYNDNNSLDEKMQSACFELAKLLDTLYPDIDGPSGIITYGKSSEQEQIRNNWDKNIKPKIDDWQNVPILTTKAEAIAMGAAVLGAVSHGRVNVLVEKSRKGGDQSSKIVADLALQVQHIAPVAVGVKFNYFASTDANKWTPVKTIFDFDRRVPAGPYSMDLSAAECVVYRKHEKDISSLSDEDFIKESTSYESAKHIPEREQAALDLRIQVVQKWTRDGDWKPVGNPFEPLVKTEYSNDKDNKETKVACERATLELGLGITGIITTNLVGDRESVVQATRSARNSMIRYYVGIALAILFFGGFLVKSYWEEYVFERDTKRLLSYYKHVLPGSIHDGDVHSARYIVWKYRGKKDKLWKMLEKKYGEPVLQTYEYSDNEADESSKDKKEESVDLDEDENDSPEFEKNVNDEPDL